MKPTDTLFRLIKSLDKSEKGYFKKFAQGYGKNQNYLLIFDAIDDQEEYDEAALLKKFRNQSFIKQFAVAKNYLWELILKSQRQYRAETSKFMMLNGLMENGEILYEKGLYEEAMKIWEKASQLALLYDEKPFVLDIETAKRRYYIDMTASKWSDYVDPSYHKSFTLINAYERMLQIQQKYVSIINFIKMQPFFRTDAQKEEWTSFMNDPLLAAANEPDDFYGKLYFNYIHNIYHLLCRDKEKALPYMRKIVELWDSNPELKEMEPIKYISAVSNYLFNLMYWGDTQEFLERIQNFTPPQLNSLSKEAVWYEHWWLVKYGYFRLTRDIDGAKEFIESTKKDVEKYAPYINKVRLMIIRFSTSIYYTTVGDYDQAGDLINLVLESKEIELRKDIQAMARIMNIVNNFDAGNILLMEHLTRSSKRFLQSNDYYYETERVFMKYMNNAVKAADGSERKKVFSQMHDELEQLFNTNDYEKAAFDTIRILDWTQSKIRGITHEEYVRSDSGRY